MVGAPGRREIHEEEGNVNWKRKRKQGRAASTLEDLKKPCREVMRERESPECSLNGRIDGWCYKRELEKVSGNRGVQ